MVRQTLNAILLVSLVTTALVACSDSSEEVAPPDTSLPDTGAPDTGDQSDTVTAGDTGTTDASTPSDTGETDAESPEDVADVSDTTVQPDTDTIDTPDAEPDVPVSCDGPGGCYACPPTTQDQFLNACTDAAFAVFDNAARLPLLNADGSLPPLP